MNIQSIRPGFKVMAGYLYYSLVSMNLPKPEKLFAQHKVRWAIYGALLSLGSPIGLWILHVYTSSSPANFLISALVYNGLGTFIVFTAFGFWAGNFLDRFDYIASHDTLTGLFNRRHMQTRIEDSYNVAQRYGHEMLLCMLDLDYFKKVNDNYGHQVGDRVLKAVAGVIKKTCRKSDIVARWGGEEFIVLCPETTLEQGRLLSERIRKNVMGLSGQDMGIRESQTISIGVVNVSNVKSETLNTIFDELDTTLYKAKHQGRNRVAHKAL